MKAYRVRTGVAVAIAAAGLIGCATDPSAPAREARIECHGVNECKGQSECGLMRDSCSGGNDCRGQGFRLMYPKDCDAAQAKLKSKAPRG